MAASKLPLLQALYLPAIAFVSILQPADIIVLGRGLRARATSENLGKILYNGRFSCESKFFILVYDRYEKEIN